VKGIWCQKKIKILSKQLSMLISMAYSTLKMMSFEESKIYLRINIQQGVILKIKLV